MNPQLLSLAFGVAGALLGGASVWGATRATVTRLVGEVAELKKAFARLEVLEVHQLHLVEDVKAQRVELHQMNSTLQDMRTQLAVALAGKEIK